MSLLSLQNIVKRYPDGRREIAVLDDVSLEVDEGDFVGIWGVRRSGKSTLLQVAAGKEPPTGAPCASTAPTSRGCRPIDARDCGAMAGSGW